MFKRLMLCGALVPFFVAIARGEETEAPIPTPVTAVPTVAPLGNYAPHVANAHPPLKQSADQVLLKKKLAELDRLQKEVDDLREATRSWPQILVRVQVLEVDLTKLQKLGVDLPSFTSFSGGVIQAGGESKRFSRAETALVNELQGVQPAAAHSSNDAATFLKAAQKHNAAKVLANPALVVFSGQPASFNVGGEFPVPTAQLNSVEFRSYGTRVEVSAKSLGNNKVRLQVCPRVSELDTEHSVVVNGVKVPAVNVRQCDFSSELEFGQSAVLSGLVEHTSASGRADQMAEPKEVQLVIVVTAESVGGLPEPPSPPRISRSTGGPTPIIKR